LETMRGGFALGSASRNSQPRGSLTQFRTKR
jgi:hypothetical protein